MLVTNPANRATLHEVLNHPWMLRGHSGPPDPHMVHREPLRPDELDRQVIRGMKGFEFGTEEEIERKLVKILESEAYIRSVQYWERKRGLGSLNGSSTFGRWGGESFSNSSLAISFESSSTKLDLHGQQPPPTPSKKSRRFSGFDYYRRKLFSPAASPPASPQSHSPPGSQNHLIGNFGSGVGGDSQKEPADPTRGFHPLISMYYLAREKMERDRVYGPGHFASSQLSILDSGKERDREKGETEKDQHTSARTNTEQQQHAMPSHHTAPPTPVRKDTASTVSGRPDYSMPLPRLPAPDPSHYSAASYDPASGTVAPSPTTPTFGPQPRARDLGLPPNTVQTGGSPTGTPVTPAPAVPQPQRRPVEPVDQQQQQQKMPRAPPAGAHRRSHSLSQRPTVLGRGWGSMFGHGHGRGAVDEHGVGVAGVGMGGGIEGPRTAGPEVTAFPVPSAVDESAEDREREREEEERRVQQQQGSAGNGGLVSGGATLVRKFGSLLVGRGGSTWGGAGEDGRKSTSSGYTYTYGSRRGTSPRPSGDALKDALEKVDAGDAVATAPAATPALSQSQSQANGNGTSAKATPLTVSMSQPIGSVHRRAATILDPQGRRGHERRSSTGAALMGASSSAGASGGAPGGTIGRNRRPSTGYSSTSGHGGRPLVERFFPGHGHPAHEEGPEDAVEGGHEHPDHEDHDLDVDDHDHDHDKTKDGDDKAEKEYKPVYLKGLFSVATTSSKSPYAIKADIRRVLDRMQVQYRETKTGFECIHSPSIDMASVEPATSRAGHGQYLSGHYQQGSGGEPQGHRPSIVKKASKLSFGMKRERGKEKEREKEKEKERRGEEERLQHQQSQGTDPGLQQPQGRPSGATALTATPSSGSSSFFNVSSHQTVTGAADHQQQPQQPQNSQPAPQHQKEGSEQNPPRSYSPVSNKSKVLPPIPRDFAATGDAGARGVAPPRSPSPLPSGEVGREVFESIARNSLSVRFEINIVKVCYFFPFCLEDEGRSSDFRFLGCHCMGSNSEERAETGGSTKCWRGGY